MGGVEAAFNMQQFVQAFAQQSRAGKKNHGNSDFDDDEIRAEPQPESSRRSATALAERSLNIHP